MLVYIKELGEKHPCLDKAKIKPLLYYYHTDNDLPTIAVSTIGKIIKRSNLFLLKKRCCTSSIIR